MHLLADLGWGTHGSGFLKQPFCLKQNSLGHCLHTPLKQVYIATILQTLPTHLEHAVELGIENKELYHMYELKQGHEHALSQTYTSTISTRLLLIIYADIPDKKVEGKISRWRRSLWDARGTFGALAAILPCSCFTGSQKCG